MFFLVGHGKTQFYSITSSTFDRQRAENDPVHLKWPTATIKMCTDHQEIITNKLACDSYDHKNVSKNKRVTTWTIEMMWNCKKWAKMPSYSLTLIAHQQRQQTNIVL
jgi:hypothetical protein